jgi:putative sugar O-methyltransferase
MQNTTSFDDLAPKIARLRAFIERNAEKSSKTPAGRTSEFWSEIFDARGNFPDLNQVAVFRREGNAAGVDHEALASLEAERLYHKRMAHQFRRLVPTDYVASIPESTLGAPYVFEQEGIFRSAAFWIQSGTSRRVLDFVERFGPKRPLRVLEIGGGIGMCAYHLHAKTEIENYLIVDLKENLYLSSLYLSSLLPERRLELHEMDGESLDGFAPQTLNFCFPGTIGRIHAKFDLVINSFSMHEMTLENVQAYIGWIGTVLADDGIFVSLNSHGKAGARNPADYGYGGFHIHHWGVFRQTPLAYFNTIAYEVVIGKRRQASPQYPQAAQDALGWLMQLGLDGELKPFCEAMIAGTLDHRQREILSGYDRFFKAETDDARAAALADTEKLVTSAIAPFVKAHFILANGDAEGCSALIRQALDLGLGDFAKIKAGILLATIARQKGESLPLLSLEGLDLAIGFPEAVEIARDGALYRLEEQAARILGKPYKRSLVQRGIGKIERITRGTAS